MNHSVVLLHKPIGMTPLAAIDLFRSKNPEYLNVKLGAAGRLDPMASGLLLVLVGEENKKRKEYEKLPKTYTLEVMFGARTDSYDLLGLVEKLTDPTHLTTSNVSQAIKAIPSSIEQPYPPYSSKPVNGKPLYFWARQSLLHTITIPSKTVHIHHTSLDAWRFIRTDLLLSTMTSRIESVAGDFRQEQILSTWRSSLQSCAWNTWPIATLSVSCTSGTYMRSIADLLGHTLQTGAIAYSITRSQIGPYVLDDATQIV